MLKNFCFAFLVLIIICYDYNKLMLLNASFFDLKINLFHSTSLTRKVRSSHRRCSVKKGVLEKETLAQLFSCEICKISKNRFFIEHLWTRLLLKSVSFLGITRMSLDKTVSNTFYFGLRKGVFLSFLNVYYVNRIKSSSEW